MGLTTTKKDKYPKEDIKREKGEQRAEEMNRTEKK